MIGCRYEKVTYCQYCKPLDRSSPSVAGDRRDGGLRSGLWSRLTALRTHHCRNRTQGYEHVNEDQPPQTLCPSILTANANASARWRGHLDEDANILRSSSSRARGALRRSITPPIAHKPHSSMTAHPRPRSRRSIATCRSQSWSDV